MIYDLINTLMKSFKEFNESFTYGAVVLVKATGMYNTDSVYMKDSDGYWIKVIDGPANTEFGKKVKEAELSIIDIWSKGLKKGSKIDAKYQLKSLPIGSIISQDNIKYIRDKNGWKKEGSDEDRIQWYHFTHEKVRIIKI